MRVILLKYTSNPEFIGALAAKLCHSPVDDNMDLLSNGEEEKVIRNILKLGHLSVLEHISFTFLIEGVSRVTTHQLVRHRVASYSQQSHRYTKIKEDNFVYPPSIQNDIEALTLLQKVMKDSINAYNKLIEMGIKKEDARYIIPQAVASNIMVTMNARELLHFFELRCAKSAQWEIRRLANKMLVLAKERAPVIFENIEVNENE